jgi:caffeoyl-CoA O-methyltransferase
VLAREGFAGPLWHEVTKSRKAPRSARRALADGAEVVFVWGGGGMVQRCVDAVAGTGAVLAILRARRASVTVRVPAPTADRSPAGPAEAPRGGRPALGYGRPMASGTEHLAPGLHEYLVSHSTPPDGLLRDLIAETAGRFPGNVTLQIGPEQGTFMTMLASLMGAREVIEVGTFTGYSSICLARGIAPGGRLICCDISQEWTSLARTYWQKAGLADRIELRLGPALDTLRSLPRQASFDLAFIDADKTGYASYWDQIVPRMRPGGMILVDNTLLHGRIFHADPDPDARAIAEFNERVLADDRVVLAMLPVGDGLTLARVR